ncbi:hypothetical protein RRF57_000266 [Xylaria bambusicola]|uniref:Uncharacterized protein n=1 Tax=Xylaria bambusicola TaxID=326684 RepID=A0AAN7U3J2_9PEZI
MCENGRGTEEECKDRKEASWDESLYLAFQVDSTKGLSPCIFENLAGFSSQESNVIFAFFKQLLIIINDKLSGFSI